MMRKANLLQLVATIAVVACLSVLSAQTPTPAPVTYTLITEPSQGLASIYDLISSAKKTIDITIYELSDTTVTSSLATAAANGVAVRVILDQNSEKKNNTTAFNYLASHKVSVHWANPTYAVTHQKTITVDQATTAIMTLNLTPQDYATTRDFAVITNDVSDVAGIETTFDAIFRTRQSPLRPATILSGAPPMRVLHFSPSSTGLPSPSSSRRRRCLTPASKLPWNRHSLAASP